MLSLIYVRVVKPLRPIQTCKYSAGFLESSDKIKNSMRFKFPLRSCNTRQSFSMVVFQSWTSKKRIQVERRRKNVREEALANGHNRHHVMNVRERWSMQIKPKPILCSISHKVDSIVIMITYCCLRPRRIHDEQYWSRTPVLTISVYLVAVVGVAAASLSLSLTWIEFD